MIRTSIRARLLVWIGLLVGAMLLGFGFTAFQLFRANELKRIDAELEPRVAAIAQTFRGAPPPGGFGPGPHRTNSGPTADRGPGFDGDGPPPEPPEFSRPANDTRGGKAPPPQPGAREIRFGAAIAALFDESAADGFFYAMWKRESGLVKHSANAPARLAQPLAGGTQPGIKYLTADGARLAYYYTERGDCALVGVSLAAVARAERSFVWWLGGAGALVLGVGLGGGGWLVTRALRPIGEIGAAARRIAAGNLHERIQPSDRDSELGQLADVLNNTFARLETSFAEQRQFTADASHEVRTPLTVIISEAQASLARPRTGQEYRETLEVCLEAAQDMRRLAESLLDLARLDSGQEANRRSACDLAEIADGCVALVRPLAEARSVTIAAELASAPLTGDPARLRQVLVNLLDNAIYYNYERGAVTVRTRREDGVAVVEVADTGSGIAPDDVPHIFQRFYRANRARTQTERRAGLGLAIVHSIVEAHGGTIAVKSQLGLGTTFTVRLPV
ncbi:MAG: HAMP domain-containing protein [Opitutae bacterium]|nr:HAMP domain-containing protein [Opitutae bacterium]